ncbi:hypothetical protein JCM24511_00842 [Saitozyma sp. JCM 24511]|nr:hypothetical protein JCM24511_00842 [Saitozyma sp. JCM 24511]
MSSAVHSPPSPLGVEEVPPLHATPPRREARLNAGACLTDPNSGAPTQDRAPAPSSSLNEDAATDAANLHDPDEVSRAADAHAGHSGAASELERDEEAQDVRSESDNSVPSGLMVSKRSPDDDDDEDVADANAVSWTTRGLPVDASDVLLIAQEMARAQRTDPDPELAAEDFPEEIRSVDDVAGGFEAISPLSLGSGLLSFEASSSSPAQDRAGNAGTSTNLSPFMPDSSATHLAISRTEPKSVRSLAMLSEGTGSPTHSALLRAVNRIAWDRTHGSSTGLQGMDSGLIHGSPRGHSVEAGPAGPSSAAGLLVPTGSRSTRATSPIPIVTLTQSNSPSRDERSSNSPRGGETRAP